MPDAPKDATPATAAANRDAVAQLTVSGPKAALVGVLKNFPGMTP